MTDDYWPTIAEPPTMAGPCTPGRLPLAAYYSPPATDRNWPPSTGRPEIGRARRNLAGAELGQTWPQPAEPSWAKFPHSAQHRPTAAKFGTGSAKSALIPTDVGQRSARFGQCRPGFGRTRANFGQGSEELGPNSAGFGRIPAGFGQYSDRIAPKCSRPSASSQASALAAPLFLPSPNPEREFRSKLPHGPRCGLRAAPKETPPCRRRVRCDETISVEHPPPWRRLLAHRWQIHSFHP